MKIILFFILSFGYLSAEIQKLDIMPQGTNKTKMTKIDILDAQILSFNRIEGEKFFGISGLAYDEDTSTLYMISDRARLFSFKLEIKDEKIIALKPISASRLRDKYGRKFFKKKSDSEGMHLLKDGDNKTLLISFEHTPRIMEFDLQGKEISTKHKTLKDIKRSVEMLQLPKILQNSRAYKHSNGMLESLTQTKIFGTITTPEYPLKRTKKSHHGIYNAQGRVCYIQKKNLKNAITELETMKDGNLLALQRNINMRTFEIEITLTKIYLEKINNGICKSEDLAIMSNQKGWAMDNFEGLTHYKNNQYLMISDDNDNMFQQTILVLFRI